MKHTAQKKVLPVLLSLALLAGCGQASSGATSDAPAQSTAPAQSAATRTAAAGDWFSDRDLEQGYDASDAVAVALQGQSVSCASGAVDIDGGNITLREEGVYLFSGTLTDGQIVVDAGQQSKVQIVLDNASITSASSAAIYCLEADKVFLTLADGSENTLANGGCFEDDTNVDGAVFSRTDLTLNGSGSLTVESPAGHGVVSKDELTITGGSYTVTAAAHGFAGKDSVAVAGGSFAVTAGKDGFHAENKDDDTQGAVCLAGGSFAVVAGGDGISAAAGLQIDGGDYTLTTGGGSAAATGKAGDTMPRQPGLREFTAEEPAGTQDGEASAGSCKGIKAGGNLVIQGGTFVLDTADDAVHANGDGTIGGGSWTIRTGDDGIHADGAVTILGGEFSIPDCYEGIEGQTVTMEDGTLDITASDDGINAAGGADGSGADFGFGARDQFAADADCAVVINGGTITIVSDGDSIDSNGSLTVNGGTLDLTCNGNGNTAIDASGTFTHNGGTITTNDGSESGTGGVGGGVGGGRMPGGSRDGARPDHAPQDGDLPQPPDGDPPRPVAGASGQTA